MLQTILLVLHILVGLSLIGLILIQQGRGATTGAAFGSGASSTVFGARGSATFLSRATAILATVFFANCLLLAYMSTQTVAPKGLIERASTSAPAAPAAPSDAPPLPAPTPSEHAQSEAPAAPAQPAPADMPSIPAEQKTTPAEPQTKQ
ncbi:MAG: preprotein translocase subunit SecG [Gammaproteobacteria bacterium]|nr:preprotein translocase subunit SecG [Gammaproteobacteria bacterium]